LKEIEKFLKKDQQKRSKQPQKILGLPQDILGSIVGKVDVEEI
jgi:hypothetical protein